MLDEVGTIFAGMKSDRGRTTRQNCVSELSYRQIASSLRVEAGNMSGEREISAGGLGDVYRNSGQILTSF